MIKLNAKTVVGTYLSNFKQEKIKKNMYKNWLLIKFTTGNNY